MNEATDLWDCLELEASTIPVDTLTLDLHPFDMLEREEVIAAMSLAARTLPPTRSEAVHWVQMAERSCQSGLPALAACLKTAWGG